MAQSGRETLENAIRAVNEKPRWAAQVVYGDTDSLFVHLPGRHAPSRPRAAPPLLRLAVSYCLYLELLVVMAGCGLLTLPTLSHSVKL